MRKWWLKAITEMPQSFSLGRFHFCFTSHYRKEVESWLYRKQVGWSIELGRVIEKINTLMYWEVGTIWSPKLIMINNCLSLLNAFFPSRSKTIQQIPLLFFYKYDPNTDCFVCEHHNLWSWSLTNVLMLTGLEPRYRVHQRPPLPTNPKPCPHPVLDYLRLDRQPKKSLTGWK